MAVAPPLTAGPFRVPPSLAAENERARQLLYGVLSDEEANVLTSEGYIPVTSNEGDAWRVYTASIVGNCVSVQRRVGYCAHVRGYVPAGDNYLAQLLAIQTDVAAFLRVAHTYYDFKRTEPRWPVTPRWV